MPHRDLHTAADAELLSAYRDTGDSAALGTLYKRYAHLVFGVCLRYLHDEQNAEDAVMEIFHKLHAYLREHDVAYFPTWLHAVSRNHCLMELRKRRPEVTVHLVPERPADAAADAEFARERERLLTAVETNLDRLRPEQKLCLELYYFQEKSYKEIADTTGFSLAEVKSHLQNGKLNLKKIVGRTLFVAWWLLIGW